jgi:hypothetical protein
MSRSFSRRRCNALLCLLWVTSDGADHATVAPGITPIPEASEQVSTLRLRADCGLHSERRYNGTAPTQDAREYAMNSALYEGYLASLAEGRRKDAGSMLDAFLRSFNTFEEREQWTHTFLRTHTYGERVRHEIYAEIIFPVLLTGSDRNDAWSLYWLAGTIQNLYRARGLYELIRADSGHV